MSEFGRRRMAREKKEYQRRRLEEIKSAKTKDRKQTMADKLAEGQTLPGYLQKDSARLALSMEWDDEGGAVAGLMGGDPAGAPCDIDDEYRRAGTDDPRIFLTTSHSPSSRLKMFAKEMKLVLPNSERLNRGNFDLKSLMASAKSNGFTDVIILHETRGRPDQMIVSHLPNGPTAYFTLYDVKLRHDIPDVGTMSEAYPQLIFHNFESKLGLRIKSVLKYLFPVCKDECKRSLAFINDCDYILFRHFVAHNGDTGRVDTLTEVGPEFTMMCHKIIRGTLEEEKAADVEYVLRPYLNTSHKRLELSQQLAWKADEEEATPEENIRDVAK